METIQILAATSSSGSPVYEEAVVEDAGEGRFRLMQSPGLALGVAAGDVFELFDDCRYHVVSRGGNVCIQVYLKEENPDIAPALMERLGSLGGRLDGRAKGLLVFTVGVSIGFPAIERALRATVDEFPKIEWYYGNVYDPADGVTPLNWW